MSNQHPGGSSRPVPGHGPDHGFGTPGAADPTPMTAPYAAAGGSPAAQSTDWHQAVPGAPEAEQRAPGWGAPAAEAPKPSAGKPWTMKRGLAVAGATVALGAAAGAGAYALTSSQASSATASAGAGGPGGGTQGFAPGTPGSQQGGPAGGGMPGQGGPNGFAAGGMPGGLSAAVHAEYVVLDGSDYTTKAEQLGTVSDVSSTSVTVKSADGFTRSYTLGSDVQVSSMLQRRPQAGASGADLTVSDIAAGGTVRIVAAKDGSGYTAESVQVVAATATGPSN
ncbi:hypothetical protein [Pseudarthrobacter sp. ATCC 49987]|uniref:hypothetical protein n=1 Tax=Pseudarthrobacter sp. ATCC 49987 TaxID=2698204 RepID=UPI001F29F289|nr:hypothetical protein [Pseudarthrobacter sp. ATCC 49987]